MRKKLVIFAALFIPFSWIIWFVFFNIPPAPDLRENELSTLTRSRVGSVSFLTRGEARAGQVVFIHGSPGEASNFAEFLLQPSETFPEFQLVSVDRPGFGESFKSNGSLRFSHQARQIRKVLADDGPVFLVGHSLGGPIATQLAAMFPETVSGLVLLAGSLDPSLEKLRWYNWLASLPPVSWVLPRSLIQSNLEMYQTKSELLQLKPLLNNITNPVTALHGKLDSLVPVENLRFMKSHFSRSCHYQEKILPDAGHFLPWKNQGEVKVAIERTIRAYEACQTRSETLSKRASSTKIEEDS